MATIPGINERAPLRPVFVNNLDELVKGQGLNEKSIHLVKEVAGLLASESSVRVTNKSSAGGVNASVGVQNGPTGVPALDNPDDVKAKEVDLEKLISYLQLATDKHQAELAKERIELQKSEMETRHADQKEKLQKSLDEMSKASAMSTFSRVFGWIMAAAAVALAVVASVATGGVAVGALVGAFIAVGMAVANETGATEKLTDAMATGLEKAGLSKQAAQIVAAVTVAAGMIVASAVGGAGITAIVNKVIGTAARAGAAVAATATQTGAAVASTATQVSAKAVHKGLDIGVKLMGLTAVGVGGGASVMGYKATNAQADVSEAEKYLVMIRQHMDESQEELEKILERIQSLYSDIISILGSESDTQNEIARKIGTMA